jgi:hypothetical protein
MNKPNTLQQLSICKAITGPPSITTYAFEVTSLFTHYLGAVPLVITLHSLPSNSVWPFCTALNSSWLLSSALHCTENLWFANELTSVLPIPYTDVPPIWKAVETYWETLVCLISWLVSWSFKMAQEAPADQALRSHCILLSWQYEWITIYSHK